MRLLPIVAWVRLGSFFMMHNMQTKCKYMMSFQWSSGILDLLMNSMVLAPFMQPPTPGKDSKIHWQQSSSKNLRILGGVGVGGIQAPGWFPCQ